MFEPRLIFEPWLELFKFCVLCYANYFNFSISGFVAIFCRDVSTLNIEIHRVKIKDTNTKFLRQLQLFNWINVHLLFRNER